MPVTIPADGASPSYRSQAASAPSSRNGVPDRRAGRSARGPAACRARGAARRPPRRRRPGPGAAARAARPRARDCAPRSRRTRRWIGQPSTRRMAMRSQRTACREHWPFEGDRVTRPGCRADETRAATDRGAAIMAGSYGWWRLCMARPARPRRAGRSRWRQSHRCLVGMAGNARSACWRRSRHGALGSRPRPSVATRNARLGRRSESGQQPGQPRAVR